MRCIKYLILTVFLAVSISACGGGSYEAPEGATITINEGEDISITDSRTGLDEEDTWATEHIKVVVKDANGIPLKDVKVWISYLWAVPNSDAVVQLYDNSDAEDSPMKVETDENGAYNLRFDFRSGNELEYSADLAASSGSATASIEFAVDTGSE